MIPQVIETIERAAKTGKIGDGKIFVSPIEEVIRIEQENVEKMQFELGVTKNGLVDTKT